MNVNAQLARGTRPRRQARIAAVILVALIAAGAAFAWAYGDRLRSPQALYRLAQHATPARAATLYTLIGERAPEIEEYGLLWAAQARMPHMDALDDLRAVIAYRPQGPAAYEAHVTLARHYAAQEAPQAEEAYRSALALHDTTALRLELAYYLEATGDADAAYTEYRALLSGREDAFAAMRRTGPDPVTVARDLGAAYYFSDAVDTLRLVDDTEAAPVRAAALAGLGRYEDALSDYQTWFRLAPDDAAPRLGLASTLAALGETERALTILGNTESTEADVARARLLEKVDPDEALAIYKDAPDPTSWWYATEVLERQGRVTETLPIYTRIARSSSYLADDAAFRAVVLARRLGDDAGRREAEALLSAFGMNWLALQAGGAGLDPAVTPPLDPACDDVLERAAALETLGRDDLAHLELLLAARFRRAVAADLTIAQALATREYIVEAQAVAEQIISSHSRAPRAVWELSYPTPYSHTIQAAATRYDLDPLLLWAIMRQESRYDPNAVSYAGARGLMQVMPATQSWVAGELGRSLAPGDAFLPEDNVEMAAWLLRFLLDYYDDDLELALAAYNGGAGSVDAWLADPIVSDRDDLLRWIGYGETREYLAKVMLNYEVYRRLYAHDG